MTSTTEPVRYGTPITSAQAARALLREIRSPILGDVEKDSNPGHTLSRIYSDREEGRLYDMLSGGERHLADIALAIWSPHNPDGARISAIGGLDPTLRRKVVIVLAYLHLGREVYPEELDPEKFSWIFGDRS